MTTTAVPGQGGQGNVPAGVGKAATQGTPGVPDIAQSEFFGIGNLRWSSPVPFLYRALVAGVAQGTMVGIAQKLVATAVPGQGGQGNVPAGVGKAATQGTPGVPDIAQ